MIAAVCGLTIGTSHASVGIGAQDLTDTSPPGAAATEVEVEPQVAVVPGDALRVAVAWNQQLADGGWEIVAALSGDGGATWTQSVVPGLTDCSPVAAATAQAGLPSLSYGPDGRLYLNALCYVPGTTTNEQLVTTMEPGAASWTTPKDLGQGTRGRVVADPKVAGSAYVAYLSGPGDTAHSVLVRHTIDGGRSWLAPTTAYASQGDDAYTADIAIVGHAARSGQARLLVALRGGLDPNWCCTFTLATRSTDGGASWSPAERVPDPTIDYNGSWPGDPQPSIDPTKGTQPYGSSGQPIRVAAAPGGVACVVWSDLDSRGPQDLDSTGATRLLMSLSSGDGRWTTPAPINATSARAFEPQVTVTSNGTVSVTYYDDRRDETGDSSWTVDLWQATSRDSGSSWQEVHLAGPMDIRPAVQESAFTDYFGVASSGDSVLTAYVSAAGLDGAPGATEGLTDVYVVRTHQ